ncbi:hypothetical protein [Microvirga massiliensis]|nr:hypothetical protein [Microvirga massiliensis]
MSGERVAGLRVDPHAARPGSAMPRYYFDVREGERFAPDKTAPNSTT